MIVEDEREEVGSGDGDETTAATVTEEHDTSNTSFTAFVQRHQEIQSAAQHYQLRHNIIEHLWQRKGEEE
jgi:hypothetical protein